ncbi:hypothetical protein KVR01_011680 [Diaporthe batatas]|uniref:uncharacterized protein n=1 Tax=Diaporthe batatas TaxID=748121 RepID=UPI001D059574|nr:uncharacterized protein KVR01_011680 [Diaporthe batatas]KAG8158558.1 hypothetical protein KVR01_011680 [Diaporthe batatas]
MSRMRRRARQTVTCWNCCYCGMGIMLLGTTTHCVTCDRAMCGFCQVYKQSICERVGPRRRPTAQGPVLLHRLEQPRQANTISFKIQTEHSMNALTQSSAYKPRIIDSGRLKYRPGLETRPEHVVLLRCLNLTGAKDEPWKAISTGETQSSPGEFTPGSESSDLWQEDDDDIGLPAKCDTIAHGLSEGFDDLFQMWLLSPRDNNDGQRAPSPSGPQRNAKDTGKRAEPRRKRPDNSDEQDEDASPGRSGAVGRKRRKMMPLDTQLACPYFKKDPRRHRACCGYGGQKLSYVKQHLSRNHTISLYCPVCIIYFPNERLRDEHIRARTCEPLENPQVPEGITMEQRIWLSRRGPPHLSEEQHWLRIFQHLFPGHPLPQSVYNDTTFSEEFLDFRDFISGPAGLDMLLSKVRESPCWTAEHETLFGPDIGEGLGQLYWLWAAARQGESNRAGAVEVPSHESQDTLSPVLDGASHQSGMQLGEELVTGGQSFDMFIPVPRETESPTLPAPQNELARVVDGREQLIYEATQLDATTINTENEQEHPNVDKKEELDEGWQSSSIALTHIPQGQPRTSLTRIDQPDTEPPDIPELGDDAQGAVSLSDFRPEFLNDGFQGNTGWNFSSTFELDDAGYLLGHLGAPREDAILNDVAEAYTGTTVMTDEEATAIIADLDDCLGLAQPPK